MKKIMVCILAACAMAFAFAAQAAAQAEQHPLFVAATAAADVGAMMVHTKPLAVAPAQVLCEARMDLSAISVASSYVRPAHSGIVIDESGIHPAFARMDPGRLSIAHSI